MDNTDAARPFPSRYLIAVLVVLGAAMLIASGVLHHSSAKHFDTRYFYIAGKCWLSGTSPYDIKAYEVRWAALLGGGPTAPFLYAPTAMLFCGPIGLLPWPLAAYAFTAMNVLAYGVIATGLILCIGYKNADWKAYVFLALALFCGPAAAVVLTGQTTLIIGAGIAMVLLGAQRGWTWLAVAGGLLASAKPHVGGPILLGLLLADQRLFKPALWTIGAAVAFTIIAILCDSAFITHLRGVYAGYIAHPSNKPEGLYGLAPILLALKLPRPLAAPIGFAAFAALLAVIGWCATRGNRAGATLLALWLPGMVLSMQLYDISIFMLGIALLAKLPARIAWPLAIAAACISRPTIVGFALNKLRIGIAPNVGVSLIWLLIVSVVCVTLIRAPRMAKPLPATE